MINTIQKGIGFRALVIGLLGVAIGLSSFAFVRAETGTEVSICISHSGGVYVIGSGYSKQDCKNNEQLLTFNIQGPQGPVGPQGPQGPAGAPACSGVCAPTFSIDKAVYAPGETIMVACRLRNDMFQVWDITPGIDGVIANGGLGDFYYCNKAPVPLTVPSETNHTYAILELVGFECAGSDGKFDYAHCDTLAGIDGELNFSVQ